MTNSGAKRLTRSTSDRMLAGVAGGLANYLGLDPTILRIAFVVLTVFGGSGVILYIVFWLLMPEE
jgi:phage shock protein C